MNKQFAAACTGLTDMSPAPAAPSHEHDDEFAGTIRLGSFDFLVGPLRAGTWCTSARRLLAWKSEWNSIQQFFQLVVPGDRETLEAEWAALSPGRPVDRVIGAKIGSHVRYLRFVAGCAEDDSAMRIAGFIQDVTVARMSGPEGQREARTSRLLNTFILLCK